MFMTDLHDLTKVIYKPGGYFIAPADDEYIGDVPNVVFCNGWIIDEDGTVYIYYASSDTRMHVATSTLPKLLDYVMNNPADGLRSATSVETLNKIIMANNNILAQEKKG
jgi:4-O-beta-D-mannosyl-D-glucose phosphorylase